VTVSDVTAPVLTLNGPATVPVVCGESYTEQGASLADACDPGASVVIGGSVDTGATGDYLLTYDATDASGNAAVQLTRTVSVTDTTAPVLTLNGPSSVILECGSSYVEAGASVSDACDLSVAVVIGGDAVNAGAAGTYTVTYDATDAASNAAVQLTRQVVVYGDCVEPKITAVEHLPASGDGIVSACETLASAATTLTVAFTEAIADPPGDGGAVDLTNPANYLLVEAGPDYDLSTVTCSPSGDDVSVAILGVTAEAGSSRARLALATTLGDGFYRLVTCAQGLRDPSGMRFDGNGDGNGGDDAVLSFRVDTTNLLANGQLDCDLGGWTTAGTFYPTVYGAWTAQDFDGAAVSGSMVMNMMSSGDFALAQCVDLAPSSRYHLDTWLRLYNFYGTVIAEPACQLFAGSGCTGTDLGTVGGSTQLTQMGVWLHPTGDVVTVPGTSSGWCGLGLTALSGAAFQGNWDGLSLVRDQSPIFFDGLETGDSAAWSVVAP
jgi:hypothetical protein